MVIGDARRKAAGRVAKEVANAGTTSQGNWIPPQVQVAANDQVPVNPPAMIDREGPSSLLQMAQYITTQDQAITAQAKWEIVTRENQHTCTMTSRLRDFTRMKPLMIFWSNVDEDTQDFLDEVYNI